MRTRVQIVGCGAVVQQIYLRPLMKLERANQLQVVALVDPVEARRQELLAWFPQARVFSAAQDDFVRDQVDLTIIASPPGCHAEQAVHAFRFGSHVLCEKPMAPDIAQCREMLAAATDSGLLLGIGMTRRFYPALRYLKMLLEEGRLGRDVRFLFREGGRYDWPIMSAGGFSRTHGGGGVLMDVGPHVLDTLQWMFGTLKVSAFEDDALNTGIEANCRIVLESESVKGIVQLSWDHDLVSQFRVMGSQAELIIEPSEPASIAIRTPSGWEQPPLNITFPEDCRAGGLRRGTPKTYSDCVYFQLVRVLRGIRHGEQPAASGEEGAAVISLINSCYHCARPLAMNWLTQKQKQSYEELHWGEQR